MFARRMRPKWRCRGELLWWLVLEAGRDLFSTVAGVGCYGGTITLPLRYAESPFQILAVELMHIHSELPATMLVRMHEGPTLLRRTVGRESNRRPAAAARSSRAAGALRAPGRGASEPSWASHRTTEMNGRSSGCRVPSFIKGKRSCPSNVASRGIH